MMYFYGYCGFIVLVTLWLFLKYRAETKNEKLRDYDSRCQIEAEQKERYER